MAHDQTPGNQRHGDHDDFSEDLHGDGQHGIIEPVGKSRQLAGGGIDMAGLDQQGAEGHNDRSTGKKHKNIKGGHYR